MRVKQSGRESWKHMRHPNMVKILALAIVMLAAQGCPTQTVYRRPLPPPSSAQRPPAPAYPPAPDYSPPPPQARAPIERAPIYEEDLKERRVGPPPRSLPEPSARTLPPQPPSPPSAPAPPSTPYPSAPAPLPEDSSLLAKITATTPPQRAASIRLTEEGRKLLESGDHARALSRLEKTIAIDSTNAYGYYFLAKAHASLGRQNESLRFLDVAESLFSGEPYWLAEVFALRGENYRTLGSIERAGKSYSQALRLNPGNRLAADGLARMQEEGQPDPR
ncbi:MAG: tetratricopeptide repeat protein [Candidatus Binatia bacterium]